MTLDRVKRNLNRLVLYNNAKDSTRTPYYLTACILRLNRTTQKFFYSAELLDAKTKNSVVIVKLEDVEEIIE